MNDIKQQSLDKHFELKGKLEVNAKRKLKSMDDLAIYYSPGVGAVSQYVAEHPLQAREYTGLGNSVAIISNGTAVLGLGDIGPVGALPVMEGKAMLFKAFAGIDGIPIVLDSKDTQQIIESIKTIAPSFGGINLEDFAAPECFEIESQLKEILDIPVMHDDQHGTAVVVLAGLINALKVVGKQKDDVRIVMVGAGAAGTAIALLLAKYGFSDITLYDSRGAIYKGRENLNSYKQKIAEFTNKSMYKSGLDQALEGADVFIGVSKANLLTRQNVEGMAKDPILFTLANPDPEIDPDLAREAGAVVIATGRSDYPNQVNNALAFPGIFRGALDNRVRSITDDHKLAAAKAIAGLVKEPRAEMIVPDVFDKRVVEEISKVIA